MRPLVARQIKEVFRSQQSPGTSVNDLLVSRRRGLRSSAGVVDQHFDCGAVDDVETDYLAGTVAAQLEGWSIQDQQIFEEFAQPAGKGLLAVGFSPKFGQLGDPLGRRRRGPLFVARSDRPVQLFDLILARLDRQSSDIVVFGKRTQFMKPDRFVRPRRVDRVEADREIPKPDTLALRRDQRIAGRKDPLIGLKHIAELGDVVLRAEPAPSVGGERRTFSTGRGHRITSGSHARHCVAILPLQQRRLRRTSCRHPERSKIQTDPAGGQKSPDPAAPCSRQRQTA